MDHMADETAVMKTDIVTNNPWFSEKKKNYLFKALYIKVIWMSGNKPSPHTHLKEKQQWRRKLWDTFGDAGSITGCVCWLAHARHEGGRLCGTFRFLVNVNSAEQSESVD